MTGGFPGPSATSRARYSVLGCKPLTGCSTDTSSVPSPASMSGTGTEVQSASADRRYSKCQLAGDPFGLTVPFSVALSNVMSDAGTILTVGGGGGGSVV